MFGTHSNHRTARPTYLLAAVASCLGLFGGQLGGGLFGGGLSHAEESSGPFMVYVDQEGVSARCGPGGEYYRTDPLRHGQALEVHVEAGDGWLGIRPPEGSFCWLPADVVKLSPSQDIGIVTEENSLAWIGTHLGKANKYLWQVQLAKGEEVAILGRAKREGPDGPKLWFRIVPPAGEFRWVHRDQVVDNPELLLRAKPQADSAFADARPTLAPVLDDSDDAYEDPQRIERSVLQAAASLPLPTPPPSRMPSEAAAAPAGTSDVIGSGVLRQREPSMANDSRPADNEDAVASSDEVARAYEAPLIAFTNRPLLRSIGARDDSAASLAEAGADAFDLRPGSPPASPVSFRSDVRTDQQLFVADARVTLQSSVVPASNVVPAPSFDERNIDSLQLELSRLMARSAPAADVQTVLTAAIAQSRSHASDIDRQRASMIVQRAQQYQDVARRRDGVTPSAAASNVAPLSYPEPIQPTSIASLQPAEEAPQEAVGYLVQVFSSRPDSPPFALTDEQGRTTHYVSASPGVNLRRYLNQSVTVRGAAGYSTGLDTPHVIATGAVRSVGR